MFDSKKFNQVNFQPATSKVLVPELADFFQGEPEWEVRGLTGVGMQAREKHVHAEVSEQHAPKTGQGHDRDAPAGPAPDHAGVKHSRVHEPGDERPGLFGVPGPVCAPGHVRPDGPGDYTPGQ